MALTKFIPPYLLLVMKGLQPFQKGRLFHPFCVVVSRNLDWIWLYTHGLLSMSLWHDEESGRVFRIISEEEVMSEGGQEIIIIIMIMTLMMIMMIMIMIITCIYTGNHWSYKTVSMLLLLNRYMKYSLYQDI